MPYTQSLTPYPMRLNYWEDGKFGSTVLEDANRKTLSTSTYILSIGSIYLSE